MDKEIPMHGCVFLTPGGAVDDRTVELRCAAPTDEHCHKCTDKRRPDTRCISGPYTVHIRGEEDW